MKVFRILPLLCLAAIAAACTSKARIECTVADAPESDVIVKMLDGASFSVLDTVKTDANGAFSYKVSIEKGQPEFIYLFRGERKLAALLLEASDNISVQADTLGNYSVRGSAEAEKLCEVDTEFSQFISNINALTSEPKPSQSELTRLYIEHYRKAVRYVVENSNSLTVIPVLYEKMNEYSPVFAQGTDAIHFRNACDSLKKAYPQSRYVLALEKETERREKMLAIEQKLSNAEQQGYPSIVLPNQEGKDISLKSLGARAVILHFWNPGDNYQKMFNLDVLKPLYNDYHAKGLEIYAVALYPDKAYWASVMRTQNLPWVNVCDIHASSSAAAAYNVQDLPCTILLGGEDDAIVRTNISGEAGLRRELANLLK